MTSDQKYCVKNLWNQGMRWAVLVCAIVVATTPCWAKTETFSADYVMITPDGVVQTTSQLYVTPEAFRMDGTPFEGQDEMPNINLTIIGLTEKNLQYLYNHDKKLVHESALDDDELMMVDIMNTYDEVDSETVIGTETVSGYACTVKEVTTSIEIMGMTFTSTETIWKSDQLNIPLRVKSEEGYIAELRNIKTEKPDAALFEPLSGYEKTNNMMVLFGVDYSQFTDMDMDEEYEDGLSPNELMNLDLDEVMQRMQQFMEEDFTE